MILGLIKWYDSDKGFGIISSTDDNNEVFLHISQWKDSYKKVSITNQLPLIFTTSIQRNKLSAINCRYFQFNNKMDWENLFISYDKIVTIDGRSYNLLELTLRNIPNDFDYSIIDNYVQKLIDSFSDEILISPSNIVNRIINSCNNTSAVYFLAKIEGRLSAFDVEKQFFLFNQQIIRGFMPKRDILIEHQNLLQNNSFKRIEDEETINLIMVKRINELENSFDILKYLNFDLSLVENENLKKHLIEKLNGNLGEEYKKYVINEIEKTHNDIGYLRNLINQHPKFLTLKTVENWKYDFTLAITKFVKFDDVLRLWQDNVIEDIEAFILENLEIFDNKQLEIIICSENISIDLARKIFQMQLNKGDFEYVLKFSKTYYIELYPNYDQEVFEKTNIETYFQLWKKGLCKIIPTDYMLSYFDETKTKYDEIGTWLYRDLISRPLISEILFQILRNIDNISDRNVFYTKYYCIEKYSSLIKDGFEKIYELNDSFNNLILWHLNYIGEFDLSMLKSKFIYFYPNSQVYIFKRLFYLKHIGAIDFTFKDLDEILRADTDLYLTNEKFKHDFVLDISTHIIIEGIKSYTEKGNFLFESDLILKDLKNNKNKKFKIEKYFEKCTGRSTPKWDWETRGEIKRINMALNGREYNFFAIYFEYDTNLVEKVKQIPGRKYNQEARYWGVPLQYQAEVLNFAKENKFFLDFEGSNYYNNLHLVSYIKNNKDIPNGIVFCEGRKANKLHEKHKKEFWWCSNDSCFMNEEINHLDKNFKMKVDESPNKQIWEYYTLLDILRILAIDLNEYKTDPHDFIKDGHYYKFLGHINAFNRLVEKLYCTCCGDMLYPRQTSHFALYRDVKFHCENTQCEEYMQTVYLNQCLNGECKNIIDSRVSKQCNLNLYICDKCGTCCSVSMFKRRLENLQLVGGYIYQELISNVENRRGHLERAEYYCYKCSEMMTDIDGNNFKCYSCNIEYNLEKYKRMKGKWTMKMERRMDYPHN